MSVDLQMIFNEALPSALSANEAAVRHIDAIFQFDIGGPQGGRWSVDCSAATGPRCVSGPLAAAQVVISMVDADLQQLLADHQQAYTMFFDGRLRLTGDLTLAFRLQELFALVQEPVRAATGRK